MAGRPGSTAAPVPFVIAHRGASARAPENTLAAFEAAVDEDGAEGLELDLQCSRDGEVVVLHDETVDRTTNGRGRASDLDLDSLRELDAGARFRDPEGQTSYAGRGVRIPTLREVLLRFPGLWLSLDLKEGGPEVEERTVALLRELNATEHVVVSAENPASSRRLARLAPECQRFFDRSAARHFYVRHRSRFWWGYDPPAHSLQVPVRHGRHRFDRRRFIDDAHHRGLAVRYWTVNDTDEMTRLIELGADGLITDHPRRLSDLLHEKGWR